MSKALVVGINKYPGSPLKACVNDACAIGELLKRNGDDSPNFHDVRVLTDTQDKSILKEEIFNLFRRRDDIALFYFSGHGAVDELDAYLVTPDAQPFDMGISVSTLLRMANESPCDNRIVIIDSCYSGNVGTTNLFGDRMSFINDGLTILTASTGDERSFEIGGHGIFTNLFIEALKGGAADITGMITPGSIYTFVDKALGAFDQRPMFKTNVTKFVSLRRVAPHIPVSVLRDLVRYFPERDMEFKLDPSFEDTNTPNGVPQLVLPHADKDNVAIFKTLQKYQSGGLVVPVDAPYMYFAAMNSKSCRLTPLGKHYWELARKERLR